MDVAHHAEPIGGTTEQFLAGLASRFQIYVIGGVLTQAQDGRGLNQAVAFSPSGTELARYTKMQPFSLAGESAVNHPGSAPVRFEIQGTRIALHICYDLRFPEIFRPSARAGTDLFVVIANWPNARLHHWVRLLQARAIENQAYVLGINRRGLDPKLPYSGRSLLVDPHGELIADAQDRDCIFQHTLDLVGLKTYRTGFPVLNDIRPDWIRA